MTEALRGWGPLQEWELHAACQDMPSEVFFGANDGRSPKAGRLNAEEIQRAKAVCAGCTVLEQCRDWSIAVGFPHGVVGGMTPRERQFARRKRGQSPTLTRRTYHPPKTDGIPVPKDHRGKVPQGSLAMTLPQLAYRLARQE